MVQKKLLDILVCPQCKGELEYHPEKPERLICRHCKLAYRVEDDIPVMLIEEAQKL
jgi:uncharacterized protein YbaR (Trm112 family)